MRPARWLFVLLAAPLFTLGAVCGGKPTIKITSPAHGAFTTAANVTLSGTVKNVNVGGVHVEVNGSTAALAPNGIWSITLPVDTGQAMNPYLARLVGNASGGTLDRQRIMVIYGQSVADGDFSFDSVALRLNDSGLDQVEPLIEQLAGGALDIQALLIAANPVATQFFCILPNPFGGCITGVTVKVNVTSASIAGFGLNVDSQTNYASGVITVSNLRVNYSTTGISCPGRLTATTTTINGNYALQPDSVDPSNVDVNLLPGTVGVNFSNFNNEFTGGVCDFPLLGDLIQLIIGDVEPLVRNGFQSNLDDPDGAGPLDSPIADGIEDALAGISITGPIGETLQVNLETPLFDVLEDPVGITLGSDTRITASVGTNPGECVPPNGTPDLAASYHVAEAFPSFGATTPVGGLPYDMGLCISTSAFNQLLKAQIECGLLRTSLTEIDLGTGLQPVTAGVLSFFIPQLASFDPSTPMRLDLEPTLAPFLTGATGPGGELGELVVPQLVLEVHLDQVALPSSQTLVISGAVDFRAGLDLLFDDQTSSLVFLLANVQDIDIEFLINNVSANEANVEQVLSFVLPDLLPALGDGLGAFPLPDFLGLQLQGVEVSRNGQFLSLFANLVSAP